MNLPLKGCEATDFIQVDTQDIQTVNDLDNQEWEDTMDDSRFDPQPWVREMI